MFHFFLDLLFPKRCVSCGSLGKYFCDDCVQKIQEVENQVCPICHRPSIGGVTHPNCKRPLHLDGLVSFFYFTSPIKEAIHKIKYKLVFDLAKELVELSLTNKNATLSLIDLVDKGYILVPVPLHKTRENLRGFNQAEILGKLFGENLKAKIGDGILQRKRNTKPQVDLKGRERRENVRAAFSRVDKNLVSGNSFLLVDDMVTTGATFHNCARALKLGGAASVWGLSIARTLPYKN